MPPASSALSTANVSDTPPANPVQGQIWWKSDTGETFIWYDDASADTGQWVQQSDASLPDAPADGKSYLRNTGAWQAQTGVIQVAAAVPYTTYSSSNVNGTFGDGVMQNGEGLFMLNLAFTPKRADSRLRITAYAHLAPSVATSVIFGLFQDAIAPAIAQTMDGSGIVDALHCMTIFHDMPSGSTAPKTFQLRAASSTGSVIANGITAGRRGGGTLKTTLTVEEYV